MSGPRGRRRPGGASSVTPETARSSAAGPWLWVTRAGLRACGLRYPPAQPAALPAGAHQGGRRRPHRAGGQLAGVPGARTRSGAASGGSGQGTASVCASTCRTCRCSGWTGRGADGARFGGRASAGRSRPSSRRRRSPGPRRSCAQILLRTGSTAARRPRSAVPGRPPRHAAALYLGLPRRAAHRPARASGTRPLVGRIEVRDLPPMRRCKPRACAGTVTGRGAARGNCGAAEVLATYFPQLR